MFDDRNLLDYDTYENYLDSFIEEIDMFYLKNRNFARMVAALRFRYILTVVLILLTKSNEMRYIIYLSFIVQLIYLAED